MIQMLILIRTNKLQDLVPGHHLHARGAREQRRAGVLDGEGA